MAVPYIDLFNLAYSTTISESVKDEIINHIDLPITESATEFSEDVYESLVFLDNMAYSGMSESVVNELIDKVFDGCSEEYLEEVYEAYIRAKALAYICEGVAPIGLTGLNKEFNRIANEKPKKSLFKRVVGGAADKIKSAVDKVSRWANEPGKPSARAQEASKIRDELNQIKAQKAAQAKAQTNRTQSAKSTPNSTYSLKRKDIIQDLRDKKLPAVVKGGAPTTVSNNKGNNNDASNRGDAINHVRGLIGTNKVMTTPAPKKALALPAPKPEAPASKGSDEVIDNVANNKSNEQGNGKPSDEVVNNTTNSKGNESGSNQTETSTQVVKTARRRGRPRKVVASTEEGNNNEPSNPSATATITEPKKEEKVSEAPADTAQDTSTDSKEQTSTSDTAETVVGGKPGSKNNKKNNDKDNQPEDNEKKNQIKFKEPKSVKVSRVQKALGNLEVKNGQNTISNYSQDKGARLQELKDKISAQNKGSIDRTLKSKVEKNSDEGDDYVKLLNYTKREMLQQAKTPEERKKIITSYKELKTRHYSPEVSAYWDKFDKNVKKNWSKIKPLNDQQNKLETKLRQKNISDEDRVKYEAEIKKIESRRHELVEP